MIDLAWLDTTLCVRLTLTLGHFLWQGAVIAAVALSAVAISRRASARVRYGVFVGALLLMAACPPVTFYVLGRAGPVAVASEGRATGEPVVDVHAPSGQPGIGAVPSDQEVEAASLAGSSVGDLRSDTVAADAGNGAAWRLWALLTTLAYMVGTTAMLGRLALGLVGGERLRRRCGALDDANVMAMLTRQAESLALRLTPTVALCTDIVVPTVIGVLRPTILLPVSMASGLSPEHLEGILAHELAHIRRYDHVVNVVQRLIEALLFFHPAVWWISGRVRVERERSCDDLVVASGAEPLPYAASLLAVAELGRTSAVEKEVEPAVALGVVGQRSDFRNRVRRILEGRCHESVRLKRPWTTLICVTGLLAVGSLLYVNIGARAQPTSDSTPGQVVLEPKAHPSNDRKGDREFSVSSGEFPLTLAAVAPTLGYDVELRFGDPKGDDGSFHDAQSVAFVTNFGRLDAVPTTAVFAHLVLGQETCNLRLEGERLTISEGRTGQRIGVETWAADARRFDQVITLPLKYGNRNVSIPVHLSLSRRDDGSPIGSYWFCAYLAGRLPWGAGGRTFEIVNLDQQMEFRNGREAALGIDTNGDGAIDPSPNGGERFALYERFVIGDATYRVTEVDPYLPRVVFRQVDTSGPSRPQATGDAAAAEQAEAENRADALSRGSVSGVVVDAATGQPIPGAYVAIDHSGDAGGTNLERFREQGIYVTTETDAQGRFKLEEVAFLDTHPLMVTHPGYVRRDEIIALRRDEPRTRVHVALQKGATIEIDAVDAAGNALEGETWFRLEAKAGAIFTPMRGDWPVTSTRTEKVKDGRCAFGELPVGAYSIDVMQVHQLWKEQAAKMRGKSLKEIQEVLSSGTTEVVYHAGLEQVVVEAGETKELRLPPGRHRSEMTIHISEDPYLDPERGFVAFYVGRRPGRLLWATNRFMHPEDHRLGRACLNNLLKTVLLPRQRCRLKNFPPGDYALFAGTVGRYPDAKSAGVFLRGTKVEIREGLEKTVTIPWREPEGPSQAVPGRLSALNTTVSTESRPYTILELCSLLTSKTGSGAEFTAAPALRERSVTLSQSEVSIWELLERIHLAQALDLEVREHRFTLTEMK